MYKRQLIGLPLFFLLKDSAGTSLAAMVMIVVMLPCFLVAMYEKHGQPLEVVIKNIIQTKFTRPKVRPYQTENLYALLEKQRALETVSYTHLMYNERSNGDAYHKTPKDNYVCASYRKKTTSCTIHFIRSEIVRDLILDALRNVATYARANKEDFEQLVMQTTSDARKRSLQSGRTELDRIMRRTNELDTLLQKLYEDYALGRLPEKRHAKLSAQYEAEQAQLEPVSYTHLQCHLHFSVRRVPQGV